MPVASPASDDEGDDGTVEAKDDDVDALLARISAPSLVSHETACRKRAVLHQSRIAAENEEWDNYQEVLFACESAYRTFVKRVVESVATAVQKLDKVAEESITAVDSEASNAIENNYLMEEEIFSTLPANTLEKLAAWTESQLDSLNDRIAKEEVVRVQAEQELVDELLSLTRIIPNELSKSVQEECDLKTKTNEIISSRHEADNNLHRLRVDVDIAKDKYTELLKKLEFSNRRKTQKLSKLVASHQEGQMRLREADVSSNRVCRQKWNDANSQLDFLRDRVVEVDELIWTEILRLSDWERPEVHPMDSELLETIGLNVTGELTRIRTLRVLDLLHREFQPLAGSQSSAGKADQIQDILRLVGVVSAKDLHLLVSAFRGGLDPSDDSSDRKELHRAIERYRSRNDQTMAETSILPLNSSDQQEEAWWTAKQDVLPKWKLTLWETTRDILKREAGLMDRKAMLLAALEKVFAANDRCVAEICAEVTTDAQVNLSVPTYVTPGVNLDLLAECLQQTVE